MLSPTGRKKVTDKPRLLVVDDEPDNLDLLYRAFHREFQVLRATSGPEALELLDREGEVAVIISDQRMPDMAGTEFLSLTATQYPDTMRIILTGYTDVNDLVEAINSGKVFKYVTKPWEDEELRAVVRQAVDTHNVLKARTQELRRTLRQESLINSVTRAIRGALSSRQILQTMVETVGGMFDASYCILRPFQDGQIRCEWYLYTTAGTAAPRVLGPDSVDNPVEEPLTSPDADGVTPVSSEGQSWVHDLVNAIWAVSESQVIQTKPLQGPDDAVPPDARAPSAETFDSCSMYSNPILRTLDIRTSLLVPLIYQNDLMAVMAIHHCHQPHRWQSDDMQLISLVADQVALALSQARTYEQVRALAKRETLVNLITSAIRSSLDPEDIFAAITQQLGQALHVDGCALSLWTRQDTFVHCVGLYDATQRGNPDSPLGWAAMGETWTRPMVMPEGAAPPPLMWTLEQASSSPLSPRLPQSVAPIDGNPVLKQLMTTRGAVVIHDLIECPEMTPTDVPLRSPARALLVVPLLADGQIIGSISLRQVEQPREWLPEEIDLAQAVAAQAAIAVQQSRLYQTTRHQAEKLLEMDRQKNELFQNISHEFRTPLTLNIGPLESAVAQGTGLSHEQSVIALRNSRRLLRLVNQLLDLQRLDAGQMQATFRPCPLAELVRQIVEAFRPYCDKRQIELELLQQDTPRVYLDVEKFDKVMYNLLSNAMKFTPAGGRIQITVWAESDLEGDRALIRVQDTGIGIREDQIPYLFERFRQADGSANRSYEGSGLGLALVKELVELHQGTVAVESTYGEGTTFTVTLRLGTDHLPADCLSNLPVEIEYSRAVVELADAETQMESLAGLAESGLRLDGADAVDVSGRSQTHEDGGDRPRSPMPVVGPAASSPSIAVSETGTEPVMEAGLATAESPQFHILVVDDNPDLRHYVTSILQEAHYRVSTARNGEEGLHLARQLRPNLILTDLMMPQMSGLEMIQAIRQEAAIRGTPIVLLTAKADEETRIEGAERGADAYLSKPFNHRELLAEVRNLIALQESERRIAELNTYLTKSVLKRFLPPALVDKAAQGQLSLDLRPEPKLVTILFSDIVGFTQLSNTLRSRRVAELLNEYLTEMTHAIFEHGGTVDKFMGDAILAVFGAPEEISPNEQVRRAIASARQMYRALKQLNHRWQQQGINEVQFRCGIHQGTAVVGMFGSIERSDYTAIGPSVNIAARIQAAADPGSILVSAAVADYLDDTVIQKYSPLKLKGVDETVLTFAIKAEYEDEEHPSSGAPHS